jgi:hypothetical protein
MSVSEVPASADQIPLSLNQQFLCAFDRGDEEGAFSDRHTLVYGWRLGGELDVETLREALNDVVERHEALRTLIVRGESAHQVVHPPSAVELVIHDLSAVAPADRDSRAEEFLNEIESGRYNVAELPHLRAVIARFDERDTVLVLVVHHTASDGWSTSLLIRDLAALYAVRRGFAPELPEVAQYQSFAVSQQTAPIDADRILAYWRGKLDGAEILSLPTDRPVPTDVPARYASHRFLIDEEIARATVKLAPALRSSPFMVMLAAYTVLLNKKTGAEDILVPTFTSGRYEERFLDTIGPFFNFLALRVDIKGCTSFRDVVGRVRATCLEAYAHDIPFAHIVAELPHLPAAFGSPDRAVFAFEALQSPNSMEREQIGDLHYTEMSRRLISQPVSSSIPNGGLWALDVLPSGELVGSLKFDRNLFDEDTVAGLVEEFRKVLWNAVTSPDSPVRHL